MKKTAPVASLSPLAPTAAQPHSTTVALPQKKSPSSTAVTNIKLPFPSTPSTPNTVVGMVLDKQGKIIESAIVEIRESNGTPVRAFKTNKLGQFFSATPLKNGRYEVEVEKDGFDFAIISLNLVGKVVAPIEIRAKN